MKTAQMKVTLLDHMGSDLSVVNAARVSFHKESEWDYEASFSEGRNTLSDQDAKLTTYLAKHNHWSPFAHCFASFRIKAPIFVARQLGKHQVGLAWNEVSRRYVDEEPEFWFPDVWRGRPEGGIKQGSSGVITQDMWDMNNAANVALAAYNYALNQGVAPEQARMILPQNTMTEWIWSGSLVAFARVCKLRLDPHAQKETGMIAEGIAAEMNKLFPVAWKELMK